MANSPWALEQFQARARDSLKEHVKPLDEAVVGKLLGRLRYVRGEYGLLSPGAKRGLTLFVGKAACNECHTGSLLSDSKFHNIGVPTPTGTATPMRR